MAKPKIDETSLLQRLVGVFQKHGYEGASLTNLSEATGLGRASLYHRFPGGKEEMAIEVLKHIDAHFEGYVLAPLGELGRPEERVRKVAERMAEFYQQGERSCVLDTLTLGEANTAIKAHIKKSMQALSHALTQVSKEAGFSAAQAKRRAEEALIGIQGALVVSRIGGDPAPFIRTLKRLPDLLTQKTLA